VKLPSQSFVFLAGVSVLALAGCYKPITTLKDYTRTEAYDSEKARWLYEHCDLMQTTHFPQGIMGSDRGKTAPDLGTYVEVVGVAEIGAPQAKEFKVPVNVGLVWACDQPTPWPREDAQEVQSYWTEGRKTPGEAVMTTCTGPFEKRPEATFTIQAPGSGELPTDKSFVRYTVKPVVVIPPARQAEADAMGVTPGPRKAWEGANHVLCSRFRDALLALRPGGQAHVSAVGVFNPQGVHPGYLTEPPQMLEWDVKLEEVGNVDLLLRHHGVQ
jgi:hypothetical protein